MIPQVLFLEMGKTLISWCKEGKNGQGLESENGDTIQTGYSQSSFLPHGQIHTVQNHADSSWKACPEPLRITHVDSRVWGRPALEIMVEIPEWTWWTLASIPGWLETFLSMSFLTCSSNIISDGIMSPKGNYEETRTAHQIYESLLHQLLF